MNVTTPDWLTRHGGELRPGVAQDTWVVVLQQQPLYQLGLAPVTGKYGCMVTLTNNGRRLDGGASHPTPEAALQGGLEDLRKALGW
jgi:hypothetical protein